MTDEKEWYNLKYNKQNYFATREWLYSRYASSLASLSGLSSGCSVLDAACGQGFFANLFCKHGLEVYGIDISETGIRVAQNLYGPSGIRFFVGDVRAIPVSMKFDCVFTRACSLYNTEDFPVSQQITDGLLGSVKDGGTFIFSYNSKLSPIIKSRSWTYHKVSDVMRHFSNYPRARIYVLNRIDILLFGKYAFNSLFTTLNVILSKTLGVGVEFICVLKK